MRVACTPHGHTLLNLIDGGHHFVTVDRLDDPNPLPPGTAPRKTPPA